MHRKFYLDLAAAGLRMPIGTDLVLRQHTDSENLLLDGARLGGVVAEAARRFNLPLGVPLMDLTLEKAALVAAHGVSAAEAGAFHFHETPAEMRPVAPTPRMLATCDAIRYVAATTDLLPVGMGIGPFSLATKLVADPITPVFLAGTGATAEDDIEVRRLERVLELAEGIVRQYLTAQIEAGAKAIILCEPAANQVYFSPKQLAQGYEVFDRYVMAPNRRVRALLADAGVDLLFHDCGELTAGMVERFATLDPAILSLGSSRCLWEDAARVPTSTVLYGNLPTKRFYSDALTLAEVRELTAGLIARMRDTRHPFILGSECDVLSVPGREAVIWEKVEAMLK